MLKKLPYVACYECMVSLQGNTSVVKSPDEYTVQVGSSRGQKEFQFDTIFMPETSQDKVFEDTNVSYLTRQFRPRFVCASNTGPMSASL